MAIVQCEEYEVAAHSQLALVGERKTPSQAAPCFERRIGGVAEHQVRELFEEMKQHHNQLVLNKLQAELSGSSEKADALFEDVKRFIALCVHTPQPLAPPRIVDQAWHQFILATKDYFDFCERYCGRYVHHQPADPCAEAVDYSAERRRTRQLAESVFGTLSRNWDECETVAKCTHNCGTGDIGVPIA